MSAALLFTAAFHVGCSSRYARQEDSAEGSPAPSPPATRELARSVGKLAPLGYLAAGDAATDSPFHTEQYDAVTEDGFLATTRHPLSTFSIDVDTASYANVRRMLGEGSLPPAGAVRIEEFLNYFRYEQDVLPRDGDPHPFAATMEVARAPWQPEHRLVRIALHGRPVEPADVPPRNLTFLLDVSGSMQPANKLGLVKQAMRELVRGLRPEDRVAIVVYAGASGLVLPPTSGERSRLVLDALQRLEAGGSTNGGDGIRLAYRIARQGFDPEGINRVILATDGDFNVGTSSRSELVELIERERESGVFLTVLGVGTGNLKDATMEELADRGNGNYAYLDGLAEARKVLVEEAGGTLVTIAKDVKIQVEWNPARVAAYRLLGYENRRLADEDFNDDRVDAGEIGAGHSVTALYEIVPAGTPAPVRDVDPLRYGTTPEAPEGALETSAELLTLKLRYKQPAGGESVLMTRHLELPDDDAGAGSEDLRFAAAVAGFAMILRDSPHRGETSYALVEDLARGATGADPDGYREEFVRLVARARSLDPRVEDTRARAADGVTRGATS